MKLIIVLFTLLSFDLIAATQVPGNIFYKLKNGNLANREVTLEVPSRGVGEVVLRGKSFEWRSTKFSSMNVHGKEIFKVDFPVTWQDKEVTFKFTGTYIRTNDKVLYYGDFYKVKGDEVNFGGGFVFKLNR